jgi:hypothetical protein
MGLLEYTKATTLRGPVIDREHCLVRACKFLGTRSANPAPNNNDYPRSCREAALALLENSRIYVDHAPRNGGPRAYSASIGRARDLRETGSGVVGNFAYNPHHPLIEQVLWDIENDPAGLGFSIDAIGRCRPGRDGRNVVEQLTHVNSIDLVSKPATTRGVHESWGGWPTASGTAGARLSESAYNRAAALGVAGAGGQAPLTEAEVIESRREAVARMRAAGRGVPYVDPAEEEAGRRRLIERVRRAGGPGAPGAVSLREAQEAAESRADLIRRIREAR